MKTLKIKLETTAYEDKCLNIINVSHKIPVWLYSPVRMLVFGSDKSTGLRLTNCHICKQPLSCISIPTGFGRPDFKILDTCTVVQTEDGRTYPMHKYCYQKEEEKQ